jgi:hypothetical protein
MRHHVSRLYPASVLLPSLSYSLPFYRPGAIIWWLLVYRNCRATWNKSRKKGSWREMRTQNSPSSSSWDPFPSSISNNLAYCNLQEPRTTVTDARTIPSSTHARQPYPSPITKAVHVPPPQPDHPGTLTPYSRQCVCSSPRQPRSEKGFTPFLCRQSGRMG